MSSQALERILIDEKILDADQMARVRSASAAKGLSLERTILALNLVDEALVYRKAAKAYGLPFVDPKKAKAEDIGKIPADQIEQNAALPVLTKAGVLYVAIDDPIKTFVADNLAFIAGCEVRCALAPPAALKEAIRTVLGRQSKAELAKTDVETSEDAPIIRLVRKMIEEALESRASDIHIEPFENRLRVRYRIDGILREKMSLEVGLCGPLNSRVKILAHLDIAEKRKPQDGRIAFQAADGRSIDIRTSVLPASHGETIVMRLLDKERNLLSLTDLGLLGADQDRFQKIIKRPNGIFLVTGPTGSGKTTTLYAALQQLNRPDIKIITAEDPVEFNLSGINQCQVRSRIGLSFARILRAMLRQAPNVILVGEIRDQETAEIAVQAALTGHLVFATLHTNDSTSAITRLVDIGVKPFLVSSAVQAILAQRLVRTLCQECRKPYQASESELRSIGVTQIPDSGITLYQATGCTSCDGTGYRGRLGIFELLSLDATLREMAFRQESTEAIRSYAKMSGGLTSLNEDGRKKVLDGVTSAEELLRVTVAM